jgi:hypothetical protein
MLQAQDLVNPVLKRFLPMMSISKLSLSISKSTQTNVDLTDIVDWPLVARVEDGMCFI